MDRKGLGAQIFVFDISHSENQSPQDEATGLEITWHFSLGGLKHVTTSDCIKKTQFMNITSLKGSTLGLAIQTRDRTALYSIESNKLEKNVTIPFQFNKNAQNYNESYEWEDKHNKIKFSDYDSKVFDK